MLGKLGDAMTQREKVLATLDAWRTLSDEVKLRKNQLLSAINQHNGRKIGYLYKFFRVAAGRYGA